MFFRANDPIVKIIEEIISIKLFPSSQEAEPVVFKVRIPIQSNLAVCARADLCAWHDQIRILDAECYPYVVLEVNGMQLESRNISHRSDCIHAYVRIVSISPHHSVNQDILS